MSEHDDQDSNESSRRWWLIPAGIGALLLVGLGVWLGVTLMMAASVSGRVTLDNEPIAGAQVVFLETGNESAIPILSITNELGQYKLRGHNGAAVRPGKYKVTVIKMTLPDGSVPKDKELQKARAQNLLVNFVPGIYEKHDASPLEFELRQGSNVVDIDLRK